MKQFLALLLSFTLSGIGSQLLAQAADPGADVEYVINATTTRAQLVQITQELAAKGITLNVKSATFNSANQVMTITMEILWDKATGAVGSYTTDNVREEGDIWIIKTGTTNCIGDCK